MIRTETKTNTQTEITMSDKKRRAIAVSSDIERIITSLAGNSYQDLKGLHIELDGTYQTVIKNWYVGMWGGFKGHGFNYECLDESSIRDNLAIMRGKLRGYMLQLDPGADSHPVTITTERRAPMTTQQKKLLHDYGKIKTCCMGNMAINIKDSDYPMLRDTLSYLEQYGYIRPLNIDSGDSRVYLKEAAFESFTENILAQNNNEETVMTNMFSDKKVFIVHGHDHTLLVDVEMLIRRIGLEPIILKDQANSGRTIIEKIEAYTDVGFGIVLYTACDEGRIKGSNTWNDRARQNVVFEHGYLCAKLGRDRVAAVNDDNIEVPSDLSGVLYIPHSSPDWKYQLMREMQAAGLIFDSLKA